MQKRRKELRMKSRVDDARAHNPYNIEAITALFAQEGECMQSQIHKRRERERLRHKTVPSSFLHSVIQHSAKR